MFLLSRRIKQTIYSLSTVLLLSACTGGDSTSLPAKDTTPPVITKTVPSSIGRALVSTDITIIFNEEIQNASFPNVDIYPFNSAGSLDTTNSVILAQIPFTTDATKNNLIIHPLHNSTDPRALQPNTKYLVSVRAVKDKAGNPMSTLCRFEFATKDYTGTVASGLSGPCDAPIPNSKPGKFAFSTASSNVPEKSGTKVLTVTRIDGSDGEVSVNFETSNGTAISSLPSVPGDYTANSGTLIFADGIDKKTITIEIVDDTKVEGDEDFSVTLNTPTGGAVLLNTINTHTVTIIDEDNGQPGSIAFEINPNTTIVNENVAGGNAVIKVVRSGGSFGIINVDYATSDVNGTATEGVDYTKITGTLTFAAGVTEQTISVPITNDPDVEPNEIFHITLSKLVGPANAILGNNTTRTVTIISDDVNQAGNLGFELAGSVVNEATQNVTSKTITLNVLRTKGTKGLVSVNFATSTLTGVGIATPDVDFVSKSGTLSFADGISSQPISIVINDDIAFEGNETFTVRLSSPDNNATIGKDVKSYTTHEVTIIDNEKPQPGIFSFTAPTSSVAENAGTHTVQVTRTGTTGAVSVNYATNSQNTTAVAGTDYVTKTGTLDFPNGVATATITIVIKDNFVFNADKTFNIRLSTPTNGANIDLNKASHRVTINENDPPIPGTLSFSSSTSNVIENGNSVVKKITVTRNGGSYGRVTTSYTTNNGTAFAGKDYATAAGVLIFNPGIISQTITLNILGDQVYEPSEDFTLTLSKPTGGAGLGVTTHTVFIKDTLLPGTLNFATVTPTAVTENVTANATVTVTRIDGSNGPVKVKYATSNGTATAGVGNDYTATSGVLTFNHNVTSQVINIPLLNDTVYEGNESFTITLSNPTGGAKLVNASNSITHTVTIVEPVPSSTTVSVASGLKRLSFSWPEASNAKFYQLMVNSNGGAGFVPVGAIIPAGNKTTYSVDTIISVHLLDWVNAKYMVSACNGNATDGNSADCTSSNQLSIVNEMINTIGYLKASNTGSGDRFGESVSLSADGSTLVIGASRKDIITYINSVPTTNIGAGAVYVFVRNGTTWSQQAYIKASNAGSNYWFGISVSLNADGTTLAVGSSGESSSTTRINSKPNKLAPAAGAVYVFTRTGTTWSQQAYVKAGNAGAQEYFGGTVSLSGDGNTLAVGAWTKDINTPNGIIAGAGEAYVFTRTVTKWNQQAYIKAGDASAYDFFGGAVTLSADGNTLAVGARGKDLPRNGATIVNAGALYVFIRSGTSWRQQAYVDAGSAGSAYASFGVSVALSADGTTLAVGADTKYVYTTKGGLLNAGVVYVFTRSGTTWSQQAYVEAGNPSTSDQFGNSVALSADGAILVVGAYQENGDSNSTATNSNESATDSGAVYIFTRSGITWSQHAYVKASNPGAGDAFGSSVSISVDGTVLSVGAIWEDSSSTDINSTPDDLATDAGAVYLY